MSRRGLDPKEGERAVEIDRLRERLRGLETELADRCSDLEHEYASRVSAEQKVDALEGAEGPEADKRRLAASELLWKQTEELARLSCQFDPVHDLEESHELKDEIAFDSILADLAQDLRQFGVKLERTAVDDQRDRKIHQLKVWPVFFMHLMEGRKRFEFRRADRAFCEGDFLLLREWEPREDLYHELHGPGRIVDLAPDEEVPMVPAPVLGEYTGRSALFRVEYIGNPINIPGIPTGFVIMSLSDEIRRVQ